MDAVPRRAGVIAQSANAKRCADSALEGSLTAGLSNTVCIPDPQGEWTSVQSKGLKEFSEFGDIARLDLSLAVSLKMVLLTYFDVRSAQQVLLQLADRTTPFPPAAHDNRVVRVKMTAFFERIPMMAANGGFMQFGEVSHIAMSSGHALVEYYDLRAAQYLLLAAGPTAAPWVPGGSGQELEEALNLMGVGGGPNINTLGSLVSGGRLAAAAAAATAMASSAAPLPAAPTMAPPPGLGGRGVSGLALAALAAEEGSLAGCDSSPTVAADSSSGNNGSGGSDSKDTNPLERAGKRPARTKVTTKEFSKYDIDPDKIQRCQDPRTTVMVRNLVGQHARKDFLSFLERCGLEDRYSFFYMPCKEHRNVPAGFAFVNFAAPSDVHKLYVMVKSGFWREFMTDPTKAPAMSYARFQGHEELAKHFNSSAVLHEHDPDKRPIFRLEVLKTMKEQALMNGKEEQGPKHGKEERAMAGGWHKEHGPKHGKEEHGPKYAYGSGHKVGGEANALGGGDLHAALSKGAQEITAILMRQIKVPASKCSASDSTDSEQPAPASMGA